MDASVPLIVISSFFCRELRLSLRTSISPKNPRGRDRYRDRNRTLPDEHLFSGLLCFDSVSDCDSDPDPEGWAESMHFQITVHRFGCGRGPRCESCGCFWFLKEDVTGGRMTGGEELSTPPPDAYVRDGYLIAARAAGGTSDSGISFPLIVFNSAIRSRYRSEIPRLV